MSIDHSAVDKAIADYEVAVAAGDADAAAKLAQAESELVDLQSRYNVDEATIADLKAKLSADEAQVADLQTKYSADEVKIAQLKAQILALTPPNIVTIDDFTQNGGTAGLWWPGSYVGGGSDRSKTVLRMTPMSSTKAGSVPAQSTGASNPLRIVRTAGSGSAGKLINPEFGNFTIEGTDQGHLYGGINVQYSDGAHIHDVAITGIPGNAGSPPGETFTLALWHADNALVENVTLDGKRVSDGALVAATLFGVNTVNNLTVRNLSANNAIYGMGVAVWDSTGIFTFDDCDFSNCMRPINFEQIHDGSIARFNRPNLSGQRDPVGRPAISFRSTLGKAKLYIVDPITDRWPIQVWVPATGTTDSSGRGTNTILRSDIHLIINGVDVSADKTKLTVQ